MDSLKFIAAYGDTDKTVELTYLKGGYFQIYIDRFYHGRISQRGFKWEVLDQNDYFTTDDMDALLERAGVDI